MLFLFHRANKKQEVVKAKLDTYILSSSKYVLASQKTLSGNSPNTQPQYQNNPKQNYSLMIWIMNEPKTTIHPHPPSGGGGNSCSSSSRCLFFPLTIAMVIGDDGGGFYPFVFSILTSTWAVKGTLIVHVRRTPKNCSYFQRYRNATEPPRRRRRPSLSCCRVLQFERNRGTPYHFRSRCWSYLKCFVCDDERLLFIVIFVDWLEILFDKFDQRVNVF